MKTKIFTAFVTGILLLIISTQVVNSDLLLILPHNDQEQFNQTAFQFNPRVSRDDTFLPLTNITIQQISDFSDHVEYQDTFNTSILSINSTHWFVKNNYSISMITSPFFSTITRESTTHMYNATNYWNWQGTTTNYFDFWIDPTGFYEGYEFESQGYNISVPTLENVTMTNVGTFEAWKITILDSSLPNAAWYEKNTGLFICSYMDWAVQVIWYNLTIAEIADTPLNYSGPSLTQASPSNNSILALGSIISIDFTSQYGIDKIEYSWDEGSNISIYSNQIETIIPSGNQWHNLTIWAYDNVGFINYYFLQYQTDDKLPGIVLNDIKNNSRIQGSYSINFTVFNGNGSIIYYWDEEVTNSSIPEGTLIDIPDPADQTERNLYIFVKNLTNFWTSSHYHFIIDNTAPTMNIHNFSNNTILKEDLKINFNVSEDVLFFYSINSSINNTYSVEIGLNHSIEHKSLEKGLYQLYLNITDEAGNSNSSVFYFEIHESDLEWNWFLQAKKPFSLDIFDEFGVYYFTIILTSNIDQYFNITFLTPADTPAPTSNMRFAAEFKCEEPEDILYISLKYPLIDQAIYVYQWTQWGTSGWTNLISIYDQVSHSWISTFDGFLPYFGLIDTLETTNTKSVKVGGGSISGFEFTSTLLMIGLVIFISRKKKNR